MTMDAMPYGFRILGPCARERKLVDYQRAFAAYAACDQLADLDSPAYLSSFQFNKAFAARVTGRDQRVATTGFDGPCWAQYVWFDIDRLDLHDATVSARRLAAGLLHRYGLDDAELLVFFSGSKGFHVGLPTALFNPSPSVAFHDVAKQFAEAIAGEMKVAIDPAIYRKVQPFRAPNSRHASSGLYKRQLTVGELLTIKADVLAQRARSPQPFEMHGGLLPNDRAVADWEAAIAVVGQRSMTGRDCDENRTALNRLTLSFICDGAEEGERHNRLFSAAANLAEFGCSLQLARALLTPAALDSGLPIREIERTIQDALTRN